MKAKHSFLLLFLIFITIVAGKTQNPVCNYSIEGKVLDEHDSSVLSFSSLEILENQQIATANFKGEFQFLNLCSGIYHIVVSHIGCKADTVEVEVKDKSLYRIFQLEHHTEMLQTVEIIEKRTEIHSLTDKEIETERTGMLAEMMEKIPGVNTLNTGDNFSKPIVHGMYGNRISIVRDGNRIANQQWGTEHSPEIDPFSIDRFELLRGTEALKYSGGNIGGVLIASQNDLPLDTGIHTDIYGIFSSNKKMGNLSASLEGRIKEVPALSWRFQSSGKKGGNTKTPNYFLDNTGIEEFNYSTGLKYNFEKSNIEVNHSRFHSKIGIFSASHFEDLHDLQELVENKHPSEEFITGFSYEINEPFQEIEHQSNQLSYKWQLNNRNKVGFSLSHQFNHRAEFTSHEHHGHEEHHEDEHEEEEEHDLHEEHGDYESTLYDLSSFSGKIEWEHTSSKSHITEVGLEGSTKNNEVEGEARFIPSYHSKLLGTYIIRNWYLKHFIVDAGLRWDYKQIDISVTDRPTILDKVKEFNSTSVSAGIKYPLNEFHHLKLNFSLAQRAPEINELYSAGVHHGTASIERGNQGLSNETNHEINLSYGYQKEQLLLNLFLYNKYIRDYIYLYPIGIEETEHGTYPLYEWDHTHANYFGADFFLRYLLSEEFQLEIDGSYLMAENVKDHSHLPFIPSNSINSSLSYYLNDTKKVSGSYFRAFYKYVAKQKNLPQNALFGSPDEYFLLGVGAGSSFTIGSNKLFVGLDVNNLLNTQYRDYMDRFRYFADSKGRDIVIRLRYGL